MYRKLEKTPIEFLSNLDLSVFKEEKESIDLLLEDSNNIKEGNWIIKHKYHNYLVKDNTLYKFNKEGIREMMINKEISKDLSIKLYQEI